MSLPPPARLLCPAAISRRLQVLHERRWGGDSCQALPQRVPFEAFLVGEHAGELGQHRPVVLEHRPRNAQGLVQQTLDLGFDALPRLALGAAEQQATFRNTTFESLHLDFTGLRVDTAVEAYLRRVAVVR